MLVNLGLTADAAAAHEHEYSSSLSDKQLASSASSTPCPLYTLASIPSMAVGALYNRYTPVDAPQESRKIYLRGMSENLSRSSSLSAGESRAAALDLARTPAPRARAATRPSRTKTSYQLAHPPVHQRHRRLRLRPKVLLQLQQTSQTPRPIPMLDVLPSSGYRPLLTHKFPSIFKGKDGLGLYDLIIAKSELFESTVSGILDRGRSPEDEGHDSREVVATICQIFKDDARAKGKVEICLNHGPTWEATPLLNGSYEFVANTSSGVQTLRWVLRAPTNRRRSAPPGSLLQQEEGKRFTFSVIDPSTRRHPVIASMTRNRIEVFDKYSKPALPTTSPARSTSAMSVVSDSSEFDTSLSGNVVETNDDLRTLIVITGIWVAFREGWSQNFSYPDSLPTLKNGSSSVASRDRDAAIVEGSSELASDAGKRRSRSYGSLSKRSNSTGAAFIERANRRSASAAGGRSKRNSALCSLPSSGDQRRDGSRSTSSPVASPRNTLDLGSGPRLTKVDFESAAATVQPERSFSTFVRGAPQWQHPEPFQESNVFASGGRHAELETLKNKRKHRISGLFDFFSKKGGHH